ncbi:hypothetical protein TWF281_000739 [Arthrobotrys megalospora]
MSFTASSNAISVGPILQATCTQDDGRTKDVSSLNLDTVIYNDDGQLKWGPQGRVGFSQSSTAIGVKGNMLSARTQKRDGSWTNSSLNLDEKIENRDGVLAYTGN